MHSVRSVSLDDEKYTLASGKIYKNKPTPVRILRIFILFTVMVLGVYCTVSLNTIHYLGIKNMAFPTRLVLQPCIQESRKSLQSWIKPPASVLHTMNDAELLWRAAFAPQIERYPYNRVPKVAFMFLTRGPLPLAPLWERFFAGNEGFYSIYVHTMPDYRANFSRSSVFFERQIPSQEVEWGEMNMCDAERRLLANAMLDFSNEWFILLSESCIPLHNFTTVYSYLEESDFSFMGSFDAPGADGRGRYNDGMAPEVTIEQWRKGSQWFEVNRELAVMIVADTIFYYKFKNFCKPDCYVDEHYFPTMLTIYAPELLANRSLTWTDWSRGGAHPATYGEGNTTYELIEEISESNLCTYNDEIVGLCYLFARKFAPSALESLLKLAPIAFGY
ncbi:hypothetical protein Nepgr_023912 [Nepenthes gracilis]|uniref:Core-2/I-branching beta-1,6-N-acetylglucosaminyltransferase family protein n=1 Tax=Nepenthes gracilis TaxID=150966 RepID=A0AAD3T3X0_NEPGR|nr:hypothetical protein Nepgr_023912 [Nepenthes gracilis]